MCQSPGQTPVSLRNAFAPPRSNAALTAANTAPSSAAASSTRVHGSSALVALGASPSSLTVLQMRRKIAPANRPASAPRMVPNGR
jgi:hypothetical protein